MEFWIDNCCCFSLDSKDVTLLSSVCMVSDEKWIAILFHPVNILFLFPDLSSKFSDYLWFLVIWLLVLFGFCLSFLVLSKIWSFVDLSVIDFRKFSDIIFFNFYLFSLFLIFLGFQLHFKPFNIVLLLLGVIFHLFHSSLFILFWLIYVNLFLCLLVLLSSMLNLLLKPLKIFFTGWFFFFNF